MMFYNLSLKKATGITQAVHGNFTGTSEKEVVVCHGKTLQLLQWDSEVVPSSTIEVFCTIQSISPLRIPNKRQDYLVITSDSGILVILRYDLMKTSFEKVCEMQYGEGGMKSYTLGRYLAVSSKGNFIMIGAVERQKCVFLLETSKEVCFKSGSPLKVCNPNLLLYDIVSIDSDTGKTQFVCLEANYEVSGNATDAIPPQKLTFYEVDIPGKNIVEKYSELLEERANFLISVPGEHQGPGGIIVCCENYVLYKNADNKADICCPIPRRKNDLEDSERDIIFVCSTTSTTTPPFFLVQTEQGDVFKLTLNTEKNIVTQIILQYLDTLPVAISLCLLENQYLFLAAEFSNHHFYELSNLGTDKDKFNSDMAIAGRESFMFTPHNLMQMKLEKQLPSLSPIMHCQVDTSDTRYAPLIYFGCGRGSTSSLQVSKLGFQVTTIANVSFDRRPEAVWTLKRNAEDYFDTYIIVSFSNDTKVLPLGESRMKGAKSEFIQSSCTLACAQWGADGFIQICPDIIRLARRGEVWDCPFPGIKKCAIDQNYIILALANKSFEFLKIDKQESSFGLSKMENTTSLSEDIHCMLLTDFTSTDTRSTLLITGCSDGDVGRLQIVSIAQDRACCQLDLPSIPVSLAIVKIFEEESNNPMTYLFIGLQSGVLLLMLLKPGSGDLGIVCTYQLGTAPVKVFPVKYMNTPAVLSVSSSAWLHYYCNNSFHVRPLVIDSFSYAANYSCDQCTEGIAAIVDKSLSIVKIEKLACFFDQIPIPLKKTPRKFVIHPESHHVVLIGTDHTAYTDETKILTANSMQKNLIEREGENSIVHYSSEDDIPMVSNMSDSMFDDPRADLGMWASTVLVINPFVRKAIFRLCLQQNVAAFSVSFDKSLDYLLVGIAKNMYINPVVCTAGLIHTYKVSTSIDDGKIDHSFHLYHTTEVEDVPAAICPFQGKVLIGVGKMLRIYEVGKKKLLRKCENDNFPSRIVSIHSLGNLIIVGDVQESFFFLGYKHQENRLVMLSKETIVNYLTCSTLVGKRTIVAGDKFGNISVIRFPLFEAYAGKPSAEEEEALIWDRGWSNKFSDKAELIGHFHVGEMISSLQKVSLFPDCVESVIYTTLSGSVGILAPLITQKEEDFSVNLERLMRGASPSLCGRNHLSFRSYYSAVKNIIDGDLCEHFNSLNSVQQKEIAEQLHREPYEVLTQLQTLRMNYAL